MTVTLNEKSGKGLSDGVVSELTVAYTIKPGHAEQLRASCARIMGAIRAADPQARQKTGLRDIRLVLFDDDRQFLLAPSFETDWDPYIDDIVAVFGIENVADLLQHVVGGFSPEQVLIGGSAAVKRGVQMIQTPALSYWNALADVTMPEIRKALRLEQAFQQVLDNPEAAQALQHPALKPLLEQAAD